MISYDFAARQFDMTIGRWKGLDELAEKYYDYSPYNYCVNNPILFKDPDGKQVEVSTKKIDRKEQITINLTAKLVNQSTKAFTPEQMKSYADRLVASIEKTFSGSEGDVTWTINANITVATEDNPVSATDHTFTVIDKEDVPGGADGLAGTTLGAALGGGKVIYLSAEILDRIPATEGPYAETGKTASGMGTLERTGPHELGHSMNEDHPTRGTNNGNVMHQSVRPNGGLKSSKTQILNIRKAYTDGRLNLNYVMPPLKSAQK